MSSENDLNWASLNAKQELNINAKSTKSNCDDSIINKKDVIEKAVQQNENPGENLPREEILRQRVLRRKEKKLQNRLAKMEEMRLQYIDSNKSNKISIIDQKTKDSLHDKSNTTTSFNFIGINDKDDNKSIKPSRKTDLIQLQLSSLTISAKKQNEKTTKITPNMAESLRKRGKVRENKTKKITKLKKNILQCRNEKNNESCTDEQSDPQLSNLSETIIINNGFENMKEKDLILCE